MRILKFGGTSVGSARALASVGEIVRRQLASRPAVVVSAHGGVTDMLLGLASEAARGTYDLGPLRERHRDLYASVDLDPELAEPLVTELDDLLRGLSLVGELTPRTQDLVASFGERMSARGVAAYFRAKGIEAEPVDAYDLGLRTDSRFNAAHPDRRCLRTVGRRLLKKTGVPVVTGFIAKDAEGNVTTLGRSGSDYTASLLGAAVEAEEVQIWTDVDGIMTADPRVVRGARSIRTLSIAEASELAYYGARVIHPSTMLPAVEKRIPIRVRNTSRPDQPGTTIVAETAKSRVAVKSIASKRGITLITVASTRMLLQSGFMARIFEVFARFDMSVDLVATSEVTVSVTVDSDRHLEEVERELKTFSEVDIQPDLSQVCVVGEQIRERVGVAAQVFSALKRARLPVRLISHGGTKINIAFLVDSDKVQKAVRALHREFFE